MACACHRSHFSRSRHVPRPLIESQASISQPVAVLAVRLEFQATSASILSSVSGNCCKSVGAAGTAETRLSACSLSTSCTRSWGLSGALVAQGSVRDNLDPMGRHTDRELIAVLKATRLWDILCGVSLSQSKGTAWAAAPATAQAAQTSAAQPPRSASRAIPPPSPPAGSLRAGLCLPS